jgi:hypothetical protein
MAKGIDPDLPAFATEPAESEADRLTASESRDEDAALGDLEPAVDDDQLDRNRSTRPQDD